MLDVTHSVLTTANAGLFSARLRNSSVIGWDIQELDEMVWYSDITRVPDFILVGNKPLCGLQYNLFYSIRQWLINCDN